MGKEPLSEPLSQSQPEPQERRAGVNGNLRPGLPPNVERGPDGKLRRKSPPEVEAVEWSAESQSVLETMRYVCRRPASKDDTHEQREYRAWLKEDRKGFLSKRSDLERAAVTATARATPTSAPAGPDEGTQRALELIDRLLEGDP